MGHVKRISFIEQAWWGQYSTLPHLFSLCWKRET